MSKRLASFNGPSTPTASPVRANSKPPTPLQQSSKDTESTFHRRLRSTLLDIRTVTFIWDDLVLRDGLDAAKTLVDTRTDLMYLWTIAHQNLLSLTTGLRNTLATYSGEILPRTVVVGPRIQKMDQSTVKLAAFMTKLVCILLQYAHTLLNKDG